MPCVRQNTPAFREPGSELVCDQQVIVVRRVEVGDLSADRRIAIVGAVLNFDAVRVVPAGILTPVEEK